MFQDSVLDRCAGAGLFLTGQESGLVETVLLHSGGASFSSAHKEADGSVLLLGSCSPRVLFTSGAPARLMVSAPCS